MVSQKYGPMENWTKMAMVSILFLLLFCVGAVQVFCVNFPVGQYCIPCLVKQPRVCEITYCQYIEDLSIYKIPGPENIQSIFLFRIFPILYMLSQKYGPLENRPFSFHIVISLSNRSSIGKSIKPFLKMKGQIAY